EGEGSAMHEFQHRRIVIAVDLYAKRDQEFLRSDRPANSSPGHARNIWSEPAHRSEHMVSGHGDPKTPSNRRVQELHSSCRCEECVQSSDAGPPRPVCDHWWNCRPKSDEPRESFWGYDHQN